MHKFFCSLALMNLLAYSSAHAAPDVPAFLKQRGWEAYQSKRQLAMPVDDAALVMYFAKGASAPGCGLLQGGDPKFIDILSAEAGEQYPQCIGINDVADFEIAGKKYLVLEYTSRETREDSYQRLFFVSKEQNHAYAVDEKIAGLPFPDNNKANGRSAIADAIKLAKMSYFKSGNAGTQLPERDFIADRHSAFAIFSNNKTATCSFAIEAGGAIQTFDGKQVTGKDACKKFLASGRLEKPGQIYYIGIFESANAIRKLALFSIDTRNHSIKLETDMAQSIMRSGKILDIKSVKKYIDEKM